MIRGGFLSEEDRKTLVALARDNLAAGRVTRRANALVLLDDGLSCQEVAKVLLFDDDTIRNWHALFEQRGLEGLTSFDMGGGSSLLSAEQAAALKAWVSSTLPKSTRQVGAWIAKEFGLVYESRSGLIALLHRLGLEYHKPEVISRKLDEKTQKAFIAHYDNTLNSMGEDERREPSYQALGDCDSDHIGPDCRRLFIGADPTKSRRRMQMKVKRRLDCRRPSARRGMRRGWETSGTVWF
jgi:transposase